MCLMYILVYIHLTFIMFYSENTSLKVIHYIELML